MQHRHEADIGVEAGNEPDAEELVDRDVEDQVCRVVRCQDEIMSALRRMH